jgi:hypothetical protein
MPIEIPIRKKYRQTGSFVKKVKAAGGGTAGKKGGGGKKTKNKNDVKPQNSKGKPVMLVNGNGKKKMIWI